MEVGFERANSNNLPDIDMIMVTRFISQNPNFCDAEVSNVKMNRATKAHYVDNAVGYVQLKRQGPLCHIWGRVTPEKRVTSTPYKVQAIVDERKNIMKKCVCLDCAASAGGCKHSIAFLFWMFRRSEEPACTAVSCYWKKAVLSSVKTQDMDLASMYNTKLAPLPQLNETYLAQVNAFAPSTSSGLFTLIRGPTRQDLISIYSFMFKFKEGKTIYDADEFLLLLKSQITDDLLLETEFNTREQSKCSSWYEVRFGRITASKIYECTKCKTYDGSLVESLLGAAKKLKTEAVKRGILLEPQVIKEVEKIKKIKFYNSGIIISKEYPVLGASPDGISEEFCLEIKCPQKNKTVTNYVKNNKIADKYYTQLQIQMMFSNRQNGLFVVASPDFETTKQISIYEIKLDRKYCKTVIEKAIFFWKNAIFPALLKMT